MAPIISVIMPSLNEEKYIERALKCLKEQKTYLPYEIIVCDGASIDRTVEIAKKYADRVIIDPIKGIAHGRNAGVKNSLGKYLINVDADTYYPPDFIQKTYEIFKREKYVGFFCGHWDLYDGKKIWWKRIFFFFIGRFLLGAILRYQSLRNTIYFAGWSICTPRWVFEKVGGFNTDPNIAEDIQYSLDIEKLGLKAYIPYINVRSSVRRFVKGMKESVSHYSKLNAGFTKHFTNILRQSKYSFKKIFGINEPDFYLLAMILSFFNILMLI